MLKKNRIKTINLSNKKILIQRADRLGDLVLALPVIEAIKESYPDCVIDMLCSNRNAGLVKNHPLINDYTVFDYHLNPSKTEKNTLIEQIKNKQYDVYISLWGNSFFETIAKRCRIPLSIGPYLSPFSTFNLSQPVKLDWGNSLIHESEFNLQILSALGIQSKPIYKLYPSTNNSLIQTNKPVVLFFFGSGKLECMIPELAIFKCIKFLLKNGKFHVVLCYGQVPEKSSFQDIDDVNFTNITVELDLDSLMVLINRADVYCGPDTGPSHMAAFMHKKCIFLYRSWDNLPTRWGPVSPQSAIMRFENEDLDTINSWSLRLQNVIQEIYAMKDEMSIDLLKRERQKASLRCLYVSNSKGELPAENAGLEQAKKMGWRIVAVSKNQSFFSRFYTVLWSIRHLGVNCIVSEKPSLLVAVINKLAPLAAKPRLVQFALKDLLE